MKKEIKLKPCPFCGGKAELFKGYSLSHVYCRNCNAQTDSLKSSKRAVELWNARPIEDDLNEQIGRLKKYSAALEQEVKTLREALKKYAKGKNYIGVSSDGIPFEFEENSESLDEMPIGWLARKALKGGEEC